MIDYNQRKAYSLPMGEPVKGLKNIGEKPWLKPVVTLTLMLLCAWLMPAEPIDPWKILSLKKIAVMMFALALIQAMGAAMVHFLGLRAGWILTGFLGGLVSSTATTASLARISKASNNNTASCVLTFLAATGAMLIEGIALVLLGASDTHFSLLLIFLGPMMATLTMIFYVSRNKINSKSEVETSSFEIWPILKLSFFILLILSASKILKNFFGQSGLVVLTFIVSLFEIHGSIIANIQMHDSGAFDVLWLGSLLAVSIIASYLSKLFLIFTLGSSQIKKYVVKITVLLFLSLLLTWSVFILLKL